MKKTYYVLQAPTKEGYFSDETPHFSITAKLTDATSASSVSSLLKKLEAYVLLRKNDGSYPFNIVRVEEIAGTEVRRLLSDRDGAHEDEQIKYAVFGNLFQKYLPRLGDVRTGVSLDEARLFDTAQEAIPIVRLYTDAEGRRIAVSTTPPVITETVLA